MAPALYTKEYFRNHPELVAEYNAAKKDAMEIPVHLLPRMRLLQACPWRTSAVNSGGRLLRWIMKYEQKAGFNPQSQLVTVRALCSLGL